MGPTGVIALLADVNEAIHAAAQDIAHFIQDDLGANRTQTRAPDASYQKITQKSLGKSIKGATDPQDRPYMFIGDTTYGKKAVKVALRTLGGRNIQIYSMGKDQPVFLMNEADEAIIIAPAVSPTTTGADEGLLRLEDVAS